MKASPTAPAESPAPLYRGESRVPGPRASATGEQASGITECNLVAEAQRGDREAFLSLHRASSPQLLAFALARLRNRDDAADVVSEVFGRALEHLPALKQPFAFRGWLYAIARRVIVDQQRDRSRTSGLPEGFEPVAPGSAPDPQAEAEQREVRSLLQEALATLSPRDRRLFDLLILQQLSGRDIAKPLQIEVSHVYVLGGRLKALVREAVLVLEQVRHARLRCSSLRAILAEFGDERSPRMRQAVQRHLRRCAMCRRVRGCSLDDRDGCLRFSTGLVRFPG